MKTRSAAIALVALLLAVPAFAQAAGAMIGIYRNNLGSLSQRKELVKLSGRSCERAGANGVLRISLGKRTDECAYRTPVLGRDLEIAATERLLSGTPKPLQHGAYLGLELRAGGGAKYELLVYPLQRKAQLVKVTKDGTKYLAIDRHEAAVQGVNRANELRLRAVNVTSGPDRGQARLLAYVGRTLVGEATDKGAGELSGRASAVVVGSRKSADGLIGSVDDLVVRVPSPF